jgi:enoyl-CoA hydratase/carnithine racemase
MVEYGVRLERKGKVALIIFDRPERRNAFNAAMWSELEKTVRELNTQLPRVIIVTGSGNAFCTGFDMNPDNPQVSGLIEAVQKQDRTPVELLIKRLQTAVNSLVTLPVPVIAAINGDAYGGGAELAARCDLRVMDPHAVMHFVALLQALFGSTTRLISIRRSTSSMLGWTPSPTATASAAPDESPNRVVATAIETSK